MSTREKITLLGLLAFSFCLRLYFIAKGSYHYDSLELLIASERTLAGGGLQYLHGPGSPLMVAIGSAFIWLVGLASPAPVFAINLIGVVFTSLSVGVLYALVRRMFDSLTALVAAFSFSLFPAVLSVSDYGASAGVSLFFALASLLFMTKYCGWGKGDVPGRQGDLALSGLCLGAVAASRLPDALFILPLLLLYSLSCGFRLSSLKPLAKSFFPALLAVPLLLYAPMVLRGTAVSLLDSSGGRFMGFFSHWLGQSSSMLIDSVSVSVYIVALVLGLWFTVRRDRRLFYFFLSWLAVMFLFYGNVDTLEPRMLVIVCVPLAVFFAVAVVEALRERSLMLVAVVAVVSWSMLEPMLPVLTFRQMYDMQESFARWVGEKTPPGAAVIAADESIFLGRYSGREVIGIPDCAPGRVDSFLARVRRLVDGGRPVYVIDTAQVTVCTSSLESLRKAYFFDMQGIKANQDWHHKCLVRHIFNERLYKLRPRTQETVWKK